VSWVYLESLQDVREIFEENDFGNKAVITDGQIIKIATDVDTLINATLFRKYQTPFTVPPQIIKSIAKSLCKAEALVQVKMGEDGALVKQEVIDYYRADGMSKLTGLRDGTLEMPGSKRLRMASTTS
jgi:hypothetical protein